MQRLTAPPGFTAEPGPGARWIVDDRYAAELTEAGVMQPEAWERRLSTERLVSTRGGTARLVTASGRTLRLKRLRRGGLLRGLWCERFAGVGRALANLHVPLEAIRRGIPTAAPVVLLLAPGPPCLWRAWLGLEEIVGGTDLLSRFRTEKPPSAAEIERVMVLVRQMHDAGLEHRDLNLGNLLLCDGSAFVIDLDRARLHSGPLPFRLRQRALRRLERSFVKCGVGRDDVLDALYRNYAAGDRRLAERLERGRAVGGMWIRLHRLGWPR